MPAVVTVFAGHRNGQVSCISRTEDSTSTASPFAFATGDDRGFVCTWDLRSPHRMAGAAVPFLASVGSNIEVVDLITSSVTESSSSSSSPLPSSSAVFWSSVALSESHAALIDWRNPKAPVWCLALADMVGAMGEKKEGDDNDSFSRALWRRHPNDSSDSSSPFPSSSSSSSSSLSSSISLFTDDGKVFVLEGADNKSASSSSSSPKLLSWSPREFAENRAVQVPCGVAAAGHASAWWSNCAIFASTLGDVSLLDTQSWRVLGSQKLGGLQDDDGDDVERKAAAAASSFNANPPLLASLSVAPTFFSSAIGSCSGRKAAAAAADEEGDGEGDKDGGAVCSVALVARADGAVAFAHIDSSITYPPVVRLFDMQAVERGSTQLIGANWICKPSLSSLHFVFSAVGKNGKVSLWRCPTSYLDPKIKDEEEDEEEEEEEEEEPPKMIEELSLKDKKFCCSDAQRFALDNDEADITCAGTVSRLGGSNDKKDATSDMMLVVGDAAGRVITLTYVDF